MNTYRYSRVSFYYLHYCSGKICTTNLNSPQRPNKSSIQNSKNSKPFESSKNDQIWTKKHYPNQTIMRKTNKKGGKKKEKRNKEKEGRGFGRLTSFFFPPFFLVFLMIV